MASPLHAATVAIPSLRITELMYNPTGGDAYEFLELQNIGTNTVDLSGMNFNGLTYTFPAGRTLAPGVFTVLVSDAASTLFATRYPSVTVAGIYTGRLSNGGEQITLRDAQGRTIESVDYDDEGNWPMAADGGGYSLERLEANGDPDAVSNWRVSAAINGSPEQPTVVTPITTIRLNELMADNISAVTNGTTATDWIELQNVSNGTLSLTGWSLSDQGNIPRKFTFPAGTSIAAGGYLVVWADSETNAPGLHAGFNLSRQGETVFLFDDQLRRVDALSFGPQAPNVALGRIGSTWQVTQSTPGAANVAATTANATNLVVNEWLADAATGTSDWFEIYNRSTNQVVDLHGLYFGTANATFRFQLPGSIGPGQFVQLFADELPGGDHVDFKLPAGGGYIAIAQTNGVELERLDYPAQSEGLTYGRLPDGSATIVLLSNGATPGASNLGDTDGDTLPDFWERLYGLDPLVANNPATDTDDDGATDLEEYRSGTSPVSAGSVLALLAQAGVSNQVILSFTAQPNLSYSILYRTAAAQGAWQRLVDFAPQAGTRSLTYTDLTTSAVLTRFYRLATPIAILEGESAIAQVSPVENATAASVSSGVMILLREPVNPATVTTNSLVVTLDGEPVSGRITFGDGFKQIFFTPDNFFYHATTYAVELADTAQTQSGTELGKMWSFTTMTPPQLVEDRSVYGQDDLQVREVRLTLFEEPGGYTLEDLLNDNDSRDDFEPEVKVLMQEGTFGGGLSAPNGVIRTRGDSVRWTDQKSFKVVLSGNNNLWRGQRNLNFNKHPYDLTRVRNKLSFDLFTGTPHLTSLRTSFVHLFINDEDYGLFTQIENGDEDFLAHHDLSATGNLYKAEFFEFFRYDDLLKLTSDTTYSKAAFETILEIKGSNDHKKLLKMLDDLNDEEQATSTVFNRYFNRDNHLTWLAMNILVNNADTASRNFFLYSPADANCWYFLPWDYDGAWGFYDQPNEGGDNLARWQRSVANWWGSAIHRRFLRDTNNVAALTAKMDELRNTVLTVTRVNALVASYHALVESFVSMAPDFDHLPVMDTDNRIAEFNSEYQRLLTVVGQNYTNYLSTLERPMPIFLGEVQEVDDTYRFVWDESYDLQGDALRYDFQISRTPEFASADIVVQQLSLTNTETFQPKTLLPAGHYFWRVIIRDQKSPAVNWQEPFDVYYDETNDRVYFGMRDFLTE